MSAELPGPAHGSQDSKHDLDGRPGPKATPGSRRGRLLAMRGIALLGFGIIFAVIAVDIFLVNVPPALKWTMGGHATTTATLAGRDGFQVTVTDNGPAVRSLVINLNAKDDWFKHHSNIDASGCENYTYTETLFCGPLDASETKTFNVTATPNSPGSFDFEIDVGSAEDQQLFLAGAWPVVLRPDHGSVTWTETVTA